MRIQIFKLSEYMPRKDSNLGTLAYIVNAIAFELSDLTSGGCSSLEQTHC